MYSNYIHTHACMHAPIGANVYPVVGRLVECASKHEITLRFRNPVTTRGPLSPPPPRPPGRRSGPFAILSRADSPRESEYCTSTPITSPTTTRSPPSPPTPSTLPPSVCARRKLRPGSFDRYSKGASFSSSLCYIRRRNFRSSTPAITRARYLGPIDRECKSSQPTAKLTPPPHRPARPDFEMPLLTGAASVPPSDFPGIAV